MSDNRFTYQHMTPLALKALLSTHEDDARLLNEPIPDPDIDIPLGLVPPLHAEEDESVLPSASHSSYPYGNPYTLSLLPLRPSARSSKKGLKGNPHTRHLHTWTDLALEDLLPWEGEEPDLNYFAGLEAEAAAAAHAAATAAAAAANDNENDNETEAGGNTTTAEAAAAEGDDNVEGEAETEGDNIAAQAANAVPGAAANTVAQEIVIEQQVTEVEGDGDNSDQGSDGSDPSD